MRSWTRRRSTSSNGRTSHRSGRTSSGGPSKLRISVRLATKTTYHEGWRVGIHRAISEAQHRIHIRDGRQAHQELDCRRREGDRSGSRQEGASRRDQVEERPQRVGYREEMLADAVRSKVDYVAARTTPEEWSRVPTAARRPSSNGSTRARSRSSSPVPMSRSAGFDWWRSSVTCTCDPESCESY